MHPLLWLVFILAALFLILVIALYMIPARITGFFRASGGEILVSTALSWCGISLVFSLEHGEPFLAVRWIRWEVMRRSLKREEPRPIPAGEEKPSRRWRPSIPEVLRFIGAVAGSISFSRFQGKLLLGLASPAATGRLYGYWSAIRYAIPADDRISFTFTPAFDREVLEGEGELVLLLHHPLRIILGILRIMTGPRRRAAGSPVGAEGTPA